MNYINMKANKRSTQVMQICICRIAELRTKYQQTYDMRDVHHAIHAKRGRVRAILSFTVRTGPNYLKNLLKKPEHISLDQLEALGINRQTFSPLVDLGAFDVKAVQEHRLKTKALKEAGISEVVLMEDRDPMFYLNYENFDAQASVPLNRHKTAKDVWTHNDLKLLIEQLHEADIKTIIGFWGNLGNQLLNPFLRRNFTRIRPIVPLSDDMNPLAVITDDEKQEIPFAEYVVRQFAKLQRDFHVDGLFLGDGLMGYRSFMDPDAPYDASACTELWTDFYKRMNQGIKAIDPKATLWAYDCMANGPGIAMKNGLDVAAIAKYIDRYVFQSYGNDAWGKEYMNVPGYSVERDRQQLSTLPEALKAKTMYTIGIGDSVEGWHGSKKNIQEKHAALKDDAKKGTLGVWSNELVRELLA